MTRLAEYENKYQHLKFRREDGILEVILHTDDGPMQWSVSVHRELPKAFADIGADPENRVVILSGTGDAFCDRMAPGGGHDPATFTAFSYRLYWEARRILQNLLDIEVPMIAAINGAARVHAELALLCDIVIASDDCVFQDQPHFPVGLVPGDGVHVIWPWLLGPNRARYFLLTGQEITALEAQRLGVVAEVVERPALLDRAWDLAREVAGKPTMTLRYSRITLTQELKERLAAGWSHGALAELVAINASILPASRLEDEEW